MPHHPLIYDWNHSTEGSERSVMLDDETLRDGLQSCYTAAGAEKPCADTGQDGDVRAGVPWPDSRFIPGTAAEAECVSDRLTGLMWAKSGNLAGGAKTWQEALDFVASTNAGAGLCGYHDWRLANVNEMESLSSATVPNMAAWLNARFFTNMQEAEYWSSTIDSQNTAGAWTVSVAHGWIVVDNKTSSHHLIPVRTGSAAGVVSLPVTGQNASAAGHLPFVRTSRKSRTKVISALRGTNASLACDLPSSARQ